MSSNASDDKDGINARLLVLLTIPAVIIAVYLLVKLWSAVEGLQ